MAAFHIAWSPVHVCDSPGTAGVNVGHRTHHPRVAEGRLVAGRGVSLGPRLLTQSGLRKRRVKRVALPKGSVSTQAMEWTIRRNGQFETGRVLRWDQGSRMKKIILSFLDKTFDGPFVSNGEAWRGRRCISFGEVEFWVTADVSGFWSRPGTKA